MCTSPLMVHVLRWAHAYSSHGTGTLENYPTTYVFNSIKYKNVSISNKVIQTLIS